MQNVFSLQSADVFDVLSITRVEVDRDRRAERAEASRPVLSGLARLTENIASSVDLGSCVESGLGALATHLGYESVSLSLLDEDEGVLYTLGSRGFTQSGVGASVPVGVGVIGACAKNRMPLRIADITRERLYGRWVNEQVARVAGHEEREIPLPGLEGVKSLLAVPLWVAGKLFGVLLTESQERFAYDTRDVETLTVAGHLLAQGIALHSEAETEREALEEPDPRATTAGAVRVRYYEADDSVFVDDEYLIKGLPGRILWLVLTLHAAEGRTTFTNRELRLHPFLKLPSYKDNLETRLLMLQRRLDEKEIAFRLRREERGRLHLACEAHVLLEKIGA
jgi:adenylate cyclase